jgi:two-component system, LytTR family, sensor kinase
MNPGSSLKKILTTALLSSLIVGIFAYASITIASPRPFVNFPGSLLVLVLRIAGIWIVNIALVYLIGKLLQHKHSVYVRYAASYIICVSFIFLPSPFPASPELVPMKTRPMEVRVRSIHERPPLARGQGFSPQLLMAFALNSIVLLILDLTLMRDKKSRIELENAELKLKNMEATNLQLKQQIHPHFLFNSLNMLKTLIKKQPDKAQHYVINLSDFLRASLYSNTLNVVAVHEEIKTAITYLEMQAIRFDGALQYTIDVPDHVQQTGFVPTFSILPLLENTFKHNTYTHEFPLNITISYHDGWISVSNNIRPKLTPEPSTGIGLHNLSERYRILSGDVVGITKTNEKFSVTIKVLEHGNSHYRG